MSVKKRVVFKKGRYVTTRKGSVVLNLADQLFKTLKPLSKKIEIAGSICRHSKTPVDIDVVLVPKNKEKILKILGEKGKFLQGGEKKITFRIKGTKVEIYYASQDNWGAMLMSYTGPSGYNIGLRTLARKKGLLLNQYGLFILKNKRKIAGKTEKEIYDSLGKKYKSPKLR